MFATVWNLKGGGCSSQVMEFFFFNSSVDAEKSFEEKEEEEYLIQRKLEIVNQRNCIVDSIDEDRLRSAFYSYASSLSATFSFLLYVTLLFRVDLFFV